MATKCIKCGGNARREDCNAMWTLDIEVDLCDTCFNKFAHITDCGKYGHGFTPGYDLLIELLNDEMYELAAKLIEDWVRSTPSAQQ